MKVTRQSQVSPSRKRFVIFGAFALCISVACVIIPLLYVGDHKNGVPWTDLDSFEFWLNGLLFRSTAYAVVLGLFLFSTIYKLSKVLNGYPWEILSVSIGFLLGSATLIIFWLGGDIDMMDHIRKLGVAQYQQELLMLGAKDGGTVGFLFVMFGWQLSCWLRKTG